MPNADYARARILNTAYDIFGRVGYTATTVRMIASQADVSLSAIPYHFESKENLFHCVVDLASQQFSDYFASIRGEIQQYLTQEPCAETAQQLLFQLLDRHIDYVFDQQNEKQLRLFFQLRTFRNSPQEVSDLLSETVVQLLSQLLQQIKPDWSQDYLSVFTYSLIGEQLFFFYHKPSVLFQLGLSEYSPESIEMIRSMFFQKLKTVLSEARLPS